MSTPDISVDQLVVDGLASTAADLAATLASLDPADRRHHRSLDRWYAGWAAKVRAHQDVMQEIVVPVLTAGRSFDDELLEAFAGGHAWIDELVGDVGDALGIVAFELGDSAWWIARAATLADRLATILELEAERQRELLADFGVEARRAVVSPSATTLRSRFTRSVRRFRPVPLDSSAQN